ncbi:MAG TPA: DUF3175 domain-containing protein [Rhizomicrobium sp.]|nr:DUF3175 domain-containing protein [Rhizomicrobium sp.]
MHRLFDFPGRAFGIFSSHDVTCSCFVTWNVTGEITFRSGTEWLVASWPIMARRKKAGTKKTKKKWSAQVTRESDALDLERGVFTSRSPRKIALSLKRSAEHSRRRKSSPYRSAMSMLTFYVNRAGKDLPPARKRVLEKAKDALRDLFDKN